MTISGFARNFSPLRILTEGQIEDIHKGTLAVLEKTGLRIEHERALKDFDKNYCQVNYDDKRVRIPSGVVEECIRRCPSSFRIKARNSKNDMLVGGNTLYVSSFPGMETVDLDSWENRKPTREEFYDAVTVYDALENIHFMGNYVPWFGFEGLPPVMCIPEGFAAQTRRSSKVLKMGYLKNSEIFTIAIAQAVGVEAMVSCMASPPLTYYTEAIDALYRGIEADFPVIMLSGGVMGGTFPATIAGGTLVNNAEQIGALVLAQLVKPGAKVMVENIAYVQNMRSGSPSFGGIESSLHNAIFCQYFRKLGVPVQIAGSGFLSSKISDSQLGYEKGVAGIITAFSGAHIMYLCGGLFGELTAHPCQAIIDNDLAGMIGRFLRGVEVNNETLAIDLIDEVGPIPGFYLDKEHTRKFWKNEQFQPKVADRLSITEWIASGKKSTLDYAREKMKEILETHRPEELTPGQEAEVERILEEARRYYKKQDLM